MWECENVQMLARIPGAQRKEAGVNEQMWECGNVGM